jgi:hypothetical protein
MECYRQTIDSNSLKGIFDIPLALRNKEVEVLIFPAERVAKAAKTARRLDFIEVPPLPGSFFEPLSEEELQAWGL